MKEHIDSVYILGLGALGSIYAERLYNMSPDAVRIIAEPGRAKALAQSGLTINGKAYDFTYVDPAAPNAPADLILVAVKSTHLLQAARDLRPFIGKDTIVLSLLNGISSEEIIGEEIGINHLLYSYGLGMDAVREGSAIRYANAGRVIFGEKRNETLTPRVRAVKDLFERAQIPYEIPVDMQKALWFKFMLNTGINQVSAVLKSPYGPFQRDGEPRRLMLSAAEEVFALSRVLNIGLEPGDIDSFLKIIDTLHPENKTSMLQDIEAGRKSEVDLFAGTVIQLGKKYNVATPVNEMLYRIIQALEEMK